MKTDQIIKRQFLNRNRKYIVRRGPLLSFLFVFALTAVLLNRPQNAAPSFVTITEFSDFQCPYCRRAASLVEQVRQTYGERVKVVFKQMPLLMHQHAFKAAQASVCAGEQNKFWEYHDRVFASNDLTISGLQQVATSVGMNLDSSINASNQKPVDWWSRKTYRMRIGWLTPEKAMEAHVLYPPQPTSITTAKWTC